MNEILDRKENLEEGEIIKLCYAFKTMYANDEHLEPLTVLLSKILEIAYDKLEGNVVLLPPETTIKMLDEEKSEKDVYVSIETNEKHYGNILEVSIRRDKFQDAYERDIYYFNKGISNSAMEKMGNDEQREIVLVRFNNFFVNKDHREAFEDFYLRDEVGNLLTRKSRILNINVEECYNLWYNNNYEGKFEPYEEDLMLLCAAMMVDNQDDFHNILSMVRMKPEIKELMESVVRDMNDDNKQ